MTYRVILLNEAVDELEEIYNFYYYKNPNAADDIYHTLLEEIDKYLSHTPQVAAIDPLMEEEKEIYRSLVVYNGLFKIVFFIKDDIVIVTQIWCCRRDPKNRRR